MRTRAARLFTVQLMIVAVWALATSGSAPTSALASTAMLRGPQHAPEPSEVRPLLVLPAIPPVAAEPNPMPLRRLLKAEVTHEIALQARRIIDVHAHDPFDTEIPFEVDGGRYVARIEQHFHPPGGEKRPWGLHPGVSVFVARRLP